MPSTALEIEAASFPWMRGQHLIARQFERTLADATEHHLRYLLPANATLVLSQDLDRSYLNFVVSGIIAQVRRELFVWHQQLQLLCSNSKYSGRAIDLSQAIARLRTCQPWTILICAEGGFGATVSRKHGGVVTCSTKQHHGVAWWDDASEPRHHTLLTARAPGEPWNWDADIGHEVAHAAIGPVPLFTQTIERESRQARLTHDDTSLPSSMPPAKVSRIFYLISELTTVSLRCEQRFTATGLPEFESISEFRNFLRLIDKLLPGSIDKHDMHELLGRNYFCLGTEKTLLALLPALLQFSILLLDQYAALDPPSPALVAQRLAQGAARSTSSTGLALQA